MFIVDNVVAKLSANETSLTALEEPSAMSSVITVTVSLELTGNSPLFATISLPEISHRVTFSS
jgi:hypothetical protein